MTTGADTVLEHLARPYDGAKVLGALLGLPHRVARQVLGQQVATSEEADRLLAAMPRILRSMAIATTDRPERCYGELRGPVLWSETMSSRSASAGDPGLFVCSTTTKAYDTDENRLLKAALDSVRTAGVDADPTAAPDIDDAVRHARQNGHRAGHLLEHRALSGVPVSRITGRIMKRTRAGSRRATYQPAVELLRKVAQPLTAELLEELADDATRQQIEVLAAALTAAHARGGHPPLRSAHGRLTTGLISYDHLGGVTVDGHLVTSPEAAAQAVGRAEAGTPAG